MIKQIAFDYLARWGWLWCLGLLLHLFASVSGLWVEDPFVFLYGLIALSALLLLVDAHRGAARAILLQSANYVKLGRTWWWMAVGIPFLLLGATVVLSAGIAWLFFEEPHFHLNQFLFALFFPPISLGMIFIGCTGSSKVFQPQRKEGWICFLIGFVGFYGVIGDYLVPSNVTTGIVVALGILCPVIAWFRAPRLVLWRIGAIAEADHVSNKNVSSSILPPAVRRRYTLFTLLLSYHLPLFGVLGLGLFAFLMVYTSGFSEQPELSREPRLFLVSGLNGAMIVSFFMSQGMILSQLRLLRLAPLTRSKITSLVVFGCTAGSLVWAGVLLLIFLVLPWLIHPETPTVQLLRYLSKDVIGTIPLSLTMIFFMSSAYSLSLLYGQTVAGHLIQFIGGTLTFYLIFFGGTLALSYGSDYPSWPFYIAFVTMVITAWLTTYAVLGKNTLWRAIVTRPK
ncbi:MAG: hypothetical protein AAF984_00525 [Verrucomicrobiota bacterium]